MKLIIVDDEVLTLEFLERAVDWEKMEITLTGKFTDGKKALKLVEKENPEIIITDIRMPEMDGLELIKKIREKNSKIKIIILSAFNEFEYARKAVDYNVTGYLLKPLDEEKLEILLYKIIKQIKDEEKKEKSYEDSIIFAKERILSELTYKKEYSGLLLKKIEEMDIDLKFNDFRLLNIRIDTPTYKEYIRLESSEPSNTYKKIESALDSIKIEYNKIILFENDLDEWIAIVSKDKSKTIEESKDIKTFMNRIVRQLYEEGINCVVYVSRVYSGIDSIYDAYQETQDIYKYISKFGENAVIISSEEIYESIKDIEETEYSDIFLKQIKSGKHKEVIKFIDDILDSFSNRKIRDFEFAYKIFLKLINKIEIEFGINMYYRKIKILYASFLKNKIENNKIENNKAIQNLRNHIKKSVINIGKNNTISRKKEDKPVITIAKEYLDSRYNTNVTLDSLCDFVAVSKNYFCYLFKKETSMSVWEYLTNLRIEKAKNFLKNTNLRVYEISYRVGYENPSYFTRCFKRIAGVTPREYNELYGGKNLKS